MKTKPPCYDDLVPRKQIAQYLHEKTGVSVTKTRIGRWIAAGEIRMIKVPCAGGYKHFTRRAYLNELVARHTFSPVPNPPKWLSRFKPQGKREFGFVMPKGSVNG